MLDIYKRMDCCDWDTLIFFYGVIMSVGALGILGTNPARNAARYPPLHPTR